jgi:uncharacterized membrane protein YhaH (DUF805 family)
MLGFLFGFNARFGRMQYLAGTLVVAVMWTAVYFAIGRQGFSSGSTGGPPSLSSMTWPAIALTAVFMWMTLMLQSMRIRDIGWDPVCVVPAWMAIPIIDKLVASNIPAWALGQGAQGTTVGALINTGLVLALMFWPSDEDEGPAFREIPRKPDREPQRSDASSVTAERIARATGAEFGRRGF